MVNQIVLTYLRAYKSKYNLKKLKAKVLSKGYSEKDYDEAMKELNSEDKSKLSKKKLAFPISSVPEPLTNRVTSENRLVKHAAIMGFILTGLFILLSFLGYLNISWSGGLFGKVLLACLFFLSCFYLYGFVIVGRKNKLKWLKISPLLFGTSIALFLLGFIGIFFYGTVDLSMGSPENGGSTTSGIIILILFLIISGILLLGVVSRYIFSISLIKNEKIIEFGGWAGMVGLLAAIFSTLSGLILLYIILNIGGIKFPETLGERLALLLLPIFKIIFQILVSLTLIFESIVLWKASNV